MEKPDDWLFKMYEQDNLPQVEEPSSSSMSEAQQPMIMHVDNSALEVPFEDEELEFSLQVRDSIATEIWDDYISDMSPL